VNDNRFGSTNLVKLHTQQLPAEFAAAAASSSKLLSSDRTAADHYSVECSMPYVSGPLFALKKEKKKAGTSNNTATMIWATYASEAVGDLLPPAGDPSMTSVISNEGACCSICTRQLSKKDKICCGMETRDHKKQWKLLRDLTGVMPGKGAVVAVDDAASLRCVLFGPHPEMGDPFCVGFLMDCIEWASQRRLAST